MAYYQRVFDCCIPRKRRVTENAFSIWLNRFLVFSVRNNLNEIKVTTVVLESLFSHNMLRQKLADTYIPSRFADVIDISGHMRGDTWRTEVGAELLCSLQLAKKFSRNAKEIRNTFKDNFYGPGAALWQWKVLTYECKKICIN